MDLEHAESVGLLLGQEFLTWLWFASETSNGLFRTKDGEAFSVTVEQKVSVQGGEGEARETAVCSGPMAELREARMGAPTPTNISTKSEPESEKNGTLASPATAFANNVLPVPGGPTKRTPFGILPPNLVYLSEFFKKSTTS